MNILLWGELDL